MDLLREYIRTLLEFSIKANRKNVHQDGTSKSRGYMSGIDKTWTGEDTNDHLHNWYKKMGLMSESLLTESIDPKIMRMIDKSEKAGYRIRLYNAGQGGSVTLTDPSQPAINKTGVGRVEWDRPEESSHGPCSQTKSVRHSKSIDGFGPLLYDVAIEASGGLMADRFEVSGEAEAVWSFYEANRDDVQVDQLDILDDYDEPQLTPDDPSDDCSQVPAHDMYKDGWMVSPLSKRFSKAGTPVIDELRKRGMLDE